MHAAKSPQLKIFKKILENIAVKKFRHLIQLISFRYLHQKKDNCMWTYKTNLILTYFFLTFL